jgi:prepilin-type N-terminal cleavage/methylation domain-containing protein
MNKGFTLLELIVVLVIVSIIAGFAFFKFKDTYAYSNKTKIKSEIALIRNSIQKLNSQNILKNIDNSIKLDDEPVNLENSQLFKNILDFPLISTTTGKKEEGKWIKTSSNSYQIYLDKNDFLKFKYEDGIFKCLSETTLCKEFE